MLETIKKVILCQNEMETKLSAPVAVIFIVGAMCGSGILALPKALVLSGWFGIPMLIICGCISAFTGSLLGKCWLVIKQRYPEYDNCHIKDPYPVIGFRAAGKVGEVATRICVFFTLFGGGVVYLLLIVGNIDNLLSNLGHHQFHTCFLIPIVAGFLLPFTWFGTPKDFPQAGFIAAITTTIGAVFIVAGLAVMAKSQPEVVHSNPTFGSFFTAFGTILFAFGGASIFPTIQVDMKKPEQFPLTVVIGIACVLAVYLSVSVAGFAVLGDAMSHDNILNNMQHNWILYTVIILITSHLLMVFAIGINPVSQDLEKFFKVDDNFSWKRVVIRSSLMLIMMFVALSVPHFSIILSVVGATTVACNSFIFPPLFYILLSRQKSRPSGYERESADKERLLVESSIGPELDEPSLYNLPRDDAADDQEASENWVNFDIPLYLKIFLIAIIVIGVFGGSASVYSGIAALVDGSSHFTNPCYKNWAVADVN